MLAPGSQLTFDHSLRQAHAALRAGRAATAERWLRVLESKAPGNVDCLWLIGAALLAQGRLSAAIESLERTLAARPDYASARVDLARAYRAAGSLSQGSCIVCP